jgi:four helix bundle protein
MATFRSFEEIDAWKKARELTRRVYAVTSKGAFARDYALRDQLRRACVSVMSNVAEGHGRGGTRELQQFLSMALGSANEVSSQLYVALDQGYIDDREFREFTGLAQESARLIGGLARYLRTTERKGSKFKTGNQEPRTKNQELRTKN